MRKLHESWLKRLVEVRDDERLTEPLGIASMIRDGLVRPSLTPAGVFALQTGFTPSLEEVALVRVLVTEIVFASHGWTHEAGRWTAPGTVLSRFKTAGLAQLADGRRGYRGTGECRELAERMAMAQ